MDTDVYMEPPELLEDMLRRMVATETDTNLKGRASKILKKMETPDRVCRLKRALYGLRQAGRQWYAELKSVLQDIGLKPTSADPCVYVDPGNLTFVLTYVDDILIVSNSRDRENQIRKRLSESFRVKDLGDARYCLGIEIKRDREGYSLSQGAYIDDIINRFGMSNCKPVGSPLAVGAKLQKASEKANEAIPYRELIGALMYAALGTRPDISHAVSTLAQFSCCPTQEHWTAAKRVLRYLQGTKSLGLKFKRGSSRLEGFVDADWGNCIIDRRSFSGFTYTLNGAAISWESRKQRTVALSSTEAEYMAISDAAKEAIHLISFLRDLGLPELAKVTLHNDNQGAGKLAENPIFHSKSKHIDIRYHFIRRILQEEPVELIYLPTEAMIADILTKSLPGPKHRMCCTGLGLCPVLTSAAQLEGGC